MSTVFDKAWATDERPEQEHSMSQSELITEFHRLDSILKKTGGERREIAMALAGIAYANKAEQNTVHLEAGGRKVKVEFGSETEYDAELIKDVMNLLGPEKFDSLFKTKLEFVAKKRELKGFLNTVSDDEAVQTAKQIIRDATITKDKTPYVAVE